MRFLLPIVCFLCIHHWNDRGSYAAEISYQDILDINNGSCYPLDSCQEPRQDDPVDNYEYTCSCHSQCWEIGTCCIDSPYKGNPSNHKCVNTGGPYSIRGYYAINVCPDTTHRDSVWKGQCETEWNGEDDILMLSPVTSLATSKTYKNYYCFKCHETTDKYVSWDIFLESDYNVTEEDYRVAYDSVRSTWVANLDDRTSIPVNVSFQYPEHLKQPPMKCDLRMKSDCADNWTDARIRDKCLAYTAVVYNLLTPYKNVHCALCNYETLDLLTCRQTAYRGRGFGTRGRRGAGGGAGAGGGGRTGGRGRAGGRAPPPPPSARPVIPLVSIAEIFHMPSGKKVTCGKDQIWDPFGKICRKRMCPLPGYVFKHGRCVRP